MGHKVSKFNKLFRKMSLWCLPLHSKWLIIMQKSLAQLKSLKVGYNTIYAEDLENHDGGRIVLENLNNWLLPKHDFLHSWFSQMNNNDNNGNIATCVFPYICSFLLYSNHIVLDNTRLDITGYKGIIFQGWIFWWSSKFQMSQPKHKWQYYHSCIAESLWKPQLHVWVVGGLVRWINYETTNPPLKNLNFVSFELGNKFQKY